MLPVLLERNFRIVSFLKLEIQAWQIFRHAFREGSDKIALKNWIEIYGIIKLKIINLI